MTRVSPLAGALLLACAATPAAAGRVPSRAEVQEALDYDLNTMCGDALENEECVSHPSIVTVRHVSCSAEGEGTALCRYDRRIEHMGSSRSRWRRAVTRFTYHSRGFWAPAFDFDLTAEASDVEGALVWEANRWCRDLIDACLDDNGNPLYAEPEYRVSRLRCRPLVDQHLACSFNSIESFGDRVGRRRSCEGVLATSEAAYGGQFWIFVRDPKRNASTLKCN